MQVMPVFSAFRAELGVRMWRVSGQLAALAVAIWLLSVYGQSRPDALGLDAPAAQFSAARADAVLGRMLGDRRRIRPAAPNAEAVRARILSELAALGVHAAHPDRHELLFASSAGTIFPAARSPTSSPACRRATGKAILLMAHSDSVAAGPGAGDDGSGVAILLETIRALKARGIEGERSIRSSPLFTDGEEAGTAGRRAYLRDPLQRAQDRRGDQCRSARQPGPQLSVPDQPRRRQADRSLCAQRDAIRHLFAVWRDLQIPAQRHRPDAHAGGRARRPTISPSSAMSRNITRRWTGARISIRAACSSRAMPCWRWPTRWRAADLATLTGADAIYLDVLGRWLPRLAAGWALPLSIAAFAADRAGGLSDPARRRALPPAVAGRR